MILLSSLFLRLGYLPTSKAVLGLPSHFPLIPEVNTTNAAPQHNAHPDVRQRNTWKRRNFNIAQSKDTCQCVSDQNKVLGNSGNLHQFLNSKLRWWYTVQDKIFCSFSPSPYCKLFGINLFKNKELYFVWTEICKQTTKSNSFLIISIQLCLH